MDWVRDNWIWIVIGVLGLWIILTVRLGRGGHAAHDYRHGNGAHDGVIEGQGERLGRCCGGDATKAEAAHEESHVR